MNLNTNYQDELLILYNLLKQNNCTISTAESCTGGMIGEALTSVPGISDYYGYGVVSYSNDAKHKLIGVCDNTLNTYGAVSFQTALEMADGIKTVSGANIGVSSTGIAGPGGGTTKKPVGLVYIAISADFKSNTFKTYKKLMLDGNREQVRKQTVKNVLCMVIEYLQSQNNI